MPSFSLGTWQYASIYSAMRRRRLNSVDDTDDVNDEDENGSDNHDKDGDVIMREEGETEVMEASRTISYRRLYLLLDEASLTFNADPERGKLEMFIFGMWKKILPDNVSDALQFCCLPPRVFWMAF